MHKWWLTKYFFAPLYIKADLQTLFLLIRFPKPVPRALSVLGKLHCSEFQYIVICRCVLMIVLQQWDVICVFYGPVLCGGFCSSPVLTLLIQIIKTDITAVVNLIKRA